MCIGFPIKTQQDMNDLAKQTYELGERTKVKRGSYSRIFDKSGAEIYLQQNRRGKAIGLNPHFSGKGQVKVKLTHGVERKNSELDGAFYGWLIEPPESNDPTSEICPILFDSPDCRTLKKIKFPLITNIQISAFAHELKLYDNKKDYELNREGNFALESFIPSGLFTPGGDKIVPPIAYAIFSGKIIAFEKKINSLTKKYYFWLLIKSIGGEFDVVIDMNLIKKDPKIGGYISGVFWLSGQFRLS